MFILDEVALSMYWTIPECCMAVVCACLPTLRPLFRGWSPESVLGSMRSAISLHSVRLKMRDSFEKPSKACIEQNDPGSIGEGSQSGDNEQSPVPKPFFTSNFITSAADAGRHQTV